MAGNVYMAKLKTGEVVFFELVARKVEELVVRKVFVLGQQGNNLIFLPWIPVKPEAKITISKDAILAGPVRMDDLLDPLRAELSRIYLGIEIATNIPKTDSNVVNLGKLKK